MPGWTMSRKILFTEDLPAKGIPFHRVHIQKMVKARRFPKPFKLGQHRNAWFEDVIDGFITASAEGRAAQYVELLEAKTLSRLA
jgi:predicted DNA-binding transcriptional regulator AlpA